MVKNLTRGGADFMDIQGYLNEIRSLAASGRATEHSYRPALERLFDSIDDGVNVINEPKQSAVGAPDFVFERKGVSIGWCEAKDIFKDIPKFKTGDYSEGTKGPLCQGPAQPDLHQRHRFRIHPKGEVTGFVSIADLIPTLPARPDQFDAAGNAAEGFRQPNPDQHQHRQTACRNDGGQGGDYQRHHGQCAGRR